MTHSSVMLSYYVTILTTFLAGVPLLNCAVFFPSNSAYGIFAAIAVPLDLGPHRNVFVSYNFEANYNLPYNWQLPTYLNIVDTRRLKNRIADEKQSESKEINDEVDDADTDTTTYSPVNSTILESDNEKDDETKSRERRSLLSRRSFYSILKQKLQMHGYNGKGCLLRMICETNASAIGDINGFFGSIIHIIFTPSASQDEGISDTYYKAEFDGKQSKCENYQNDCPENILDFISTPIHELENKK